MSNFIYEDKYINVPGLNYCTILPSGRILCRHPNNEGSVLIFDQYGKNTKLYIPDAKYRNLTTKSTFCTRTDYDAMGNTSWHTPVFNYQTYKYILGVAGPSSSKPLSETLTDTELQTVLDQAISNSSFKYDNTAKNGTDAILKSFDANAVPANNVRKLVPTGLRACDLPNAYEAAVIWLESDNIDAIDPTVNSYSTNRLGSPSRFNKTDIWLCTQVKAQNGKGDFACTTFGDTGEFSANMYNNSAIQYPSLPVLEL